MIINWNHNLRRALKRASAMILCCFSLWILSISVLLPPALAQSTQTQPSNEQNLLQQLWEWGENFIEGVLSPPSEAAPSDDLLPTQPVPSGSISDEDLLDARTMGDSDQTPNPPRGENCSNLAGILRPLVPDAEFSLTSEQANSLDWFHLIWGLTTSTNPTFWFFYTPYSSEPLLAKLVLLDRFYRSPLFEPLEFSLPLEPGIFHIQLAAEYKLDKTDAYQWYVSVICDREKPSRNPSIDGWVQRIDMPPNLASDLQNTPQELAYTVYGRYRIWYEAITELIRAKQVDEDALNIWQKITPLFELTGDENILDCCDLAPSSENL